MKTITLILFILLSEVSLGQIRLEGVLLDQKSKEPIAYATVGNLDLGFGTVTNSDGSFVLTHKDSLSGKKLTFSAVGYKARDLEVVSLIGTEKLTVYLEEEISELDGVIVSGNKSRRRKRKLIGNTQFNTGTMRLDEHLNGGAMALLISHEDSPFNVNRAKLWIANNTLPSFKVRVRVLDVDPHTGMPGKDLLQENVVVESDIQKGWLEFDLTKYYVHIKHDDFYLVFEWIMDKSDKELIAKQIQEHLEDSPESLSSDSIVTGKELVNEQIIKDFQTGVWFGTLLHGVIGQNLTCYYRLSSFDDWKISAAKLAASVMLFQ